jgi:transposase, IS5 family
MGEERIMSLLQESLAVAVKTGAMKPSDARRVIVDTTVQSKNVMFPTDTKLIHRAREKLVKLARTVGLDLRQSYARIGKRVLISYQRYAHAHQFKRAGKALRKLKTYLGRTIRDIGRQIAGEDDLKAIFRDRCTWQPGFLIRTATSAAARSTACMHPRSNVSARARRTLLTSLA